MTTTQLLEIATRINLSLILVAINRAYHHKDADVEGEIDNAIRSLRALIASLDYHHDTCPAFRFSHMNAGAALLEQTIDSTCSAIACLEYAQQVLPNLNESAKQTATAIYHHSNSVRILELGIRTLDTIALCG